MKDLILKDPMYISILRIIYKKKKVRPVELAKIFELTRQAIDYRLNNLIKEGYVTKEYIQGKVYYKLTERGIQVVGKDQKYRILRDSREMSVNNYPIFMKDKLGIMMFLLFFLIGCIGFIYFLLAGEASRAFASFVIWLILGILVSLVIRRSMVLI